MQEALLVDLIYLHSMKSPPMVLRLLTQSPRIECSLNRHEGSLRRVSTSELTLSTQLLNEMTLELWPERNERRSNSSSLPKSHIIRAINTILWLWSRLNCFEKSLELKLQAPRSDYLRLPFREPIGEMVCQARRFDSTTP